MAVRIESGAWPPGALFSGQHQIPGEDGVSRHTALQAVQVLQARSLIVTRPSQGSYIAPRRSNAAAGYKTSSRKVPMMPRPTNEAFSNASPTREGTCEPASGCSGYEKDLEEAMKHEGIARPDGFPGAGSQPPI
ncbi:hypothetical protein FPZ12_003145 [Amycolatopsis acidicola]|uniref:HTH gntR-type domain-containing protein n=1 Tax=Amycolatopsis acidicola TaxID=2596893 RepID=A0A5N0VIE6_9PSEU|nr:hypothetical protein FPZ12_003145 [Amycolatopsis acidicola]